MCNKSNKRLLMLCSVNQKSLCVEFEEIKLWIGFLELESNVLHPEVHKWSHGHEIDNNGDE